jgi:hypothetical protein
MLSLSPFDRIRYLVNSMLVGGLLVFAASGADAAQLTLSWADNAGGTATFKIERKTGTAGTYTQIATTGIGVTTYADSAIASGTTYCYRVRASNSSGDSGYSNEACGSAAAALFNLTVGKTGTGSGTVASAPAGINCGLDCAESFAAGTVVTLTAVPATGSSFSGWSGGGCTGTSPCVVTGNTAMTVTAGFGLNPVPAPDTTPPTVGITSPTHGAPVSGSVGITVSASDNVAVTRVELWVDGALVSTDPSSPWSFAWDSSSKPDGTHSLQARAYDAAGNVGTSTSISVSVSNGQPGSAPVVSLAFAGRTRDRVGQGNSARTPDGALDGAFTLALASGSRTLTQLELHRMNNSGIWDTVSSNIYWTLGVASSLDGPLLNTPGDSVNLTLAAGSPLVLFAADTTAFGYAAFAPGTSFTVTATFADGSTASATATVQP